MQHRQSIALTAADSGTNANTARQANGGVTESKDALFSIGWHQQRPRGAAATAAGGGLVRQSTMVGGNVRSTTAFSRQTAGSSSNGPRRVFYETPEGQYVTKADFDRLQAEQRRREELLKAPQSALKSFFNAVTEDDAKNYDAFVTYIVQKARHLGRLLVCAASGASAVEVMLFFLVADPPGSGLFAASLTGSGTYPALSPYSDALPCTLDLGKCLVLYVYAAMYQPLGYFFLAVSLLGVLLGFMPFAYEASLAAGHRSYSKKLLLLQRTVADANADPRTRAKAADELGKYRPLQSRAVTVLRYFLTPAVFTNVACWGCTLAVMSVEHDRRTKASMVGIDSGAYSTLQYSILARCGANVLGLLVSFATSGDYVPSNPAVFTTTTDATAAAAGPGGHDEPSS